MILWISHHYLALTIRLFLAAHLASSNLIEDCRDGLPGDQVKLIPASSNHPLRKFRVIQLWDKGTNTANAEPTSFDKTVLTPFVSRDSRASNRRRWPARRPSPLRVDLVEEARKIEDKYRKIIEEVENQRAHFSEWEREADDGLNPSPGETMEAYCTRVRPRLHQRW